MQCVYSKHNANYRCYWIDHKNIDSLEKERFNMKEVVKDTKQYKII